MDAIGIQGPGPAAVALHDLQRPPQGLRRDAPRLVHALADPRDHHVAGQLAELRLARGEPCHQQADRVRPEVDGGHSPAGFLVVNGLGLRQLLLDPAPNRIGPPGHEVGVVGVQALHASGSPADPTPGLRPSLQPAPLLRVLIVGPAEGGSGVRVLLGPLVEPFDPAVGFEPGNGPHRLGAGQPVERGEGVPAGVDRPVPDHQGMSACAASQHHEGNRWLPPELGRDRLTIGLTSYLGAVLLSLVLDGALVVDLSLLGLSHEALQHLLEAGVPPTALHTGRWILEGFDRQVDLAVFLDGNHLGLDAVPQVEVLFDGTNVVSVDLGDVDEADLAIIELKERAVRGDAVNVAVDDRSDL